MAKYPYTQRLVGSIPGLVDRRVLVTGASGQLGCGIVSGLIASGARVLATDLSYDGLVTAQKRWSWPQDRVSIMQMNVTNYNEIESAYSFGDSTFGGIDMLINNAGVSVFEPYLERPESSIDWVMDVNLKGTIFCIQEFIKRRNQLGAGGEIVNVSSHYGVISPDPRIYTDCLRKNSEIYGATKSGIIQLTRYFAVHLVEYGIRVNSVSPGGIRNPDFPQGPDFQANYGFRCPLGRMADTDEIVMPILFLLSPISSYINGHNLIVDGGMSCW